VVNVIRLLLLPASGGNWTEMIFLLQVHIDVRLKGGGEVNRFADHQIVINLLH